MCVEVVAGQLEPVIEGQLERGIGGLALALDGAVVKADVLAAHEHAVGLPVTDHVDTTVRILPDLGRNRRTVPRTEEPVIGARACRVFAMEDDAILVEALGGVCTRTIFARRAVPSGIGKITVHQKTPATIVIEGDETAGLRSRFARG